MMSSGLTSCWLTSASFVLLLASDINLSTSVRKSTLTGLTGGIQKMRKKLAKIQSRRKEKNPTHATLLSWLKEGISPETQNIRDAAEHSQKVMQDKLESQAAENIAVTANMLRMVFMEQLAYIPFARHQSIVEMFDAFGHGNILGKHKTHRSDMSAAKMTNFISKHLLENLCTKLLETQQPTGLIIDESNAYTELANFDYCTKHILF